LTNRLKLYYSETEPEGALKNFFTEMAKFEVKEKKKLNFQLLLDYTSSLLIFYNGKTHKLSAKIAGYRDKKINLKLSENSFVFLLKFKPEEFYILNDGKIEKFKNKLTAFHDIKFDDSKISDNEIMKVIIKYFEKKKPDFSSVKKYVVHAINTIVLKNGIYKAEAISSEVSVRQFQRDFKKVTGFSPKEFSSIVRINSLTSELVKENVSLRDIFFDFGFYDQAHFNKEFKKITGANPSLFESRQKLIKYLNLIN
jgi:AraC-like DNA-binding protein